MRAKRTFSTTVQRTVKANRTKAWDAWANSARLSRWFTTSARQDFRVGGRYQNGDGDSGTFLRIVPKSLLCFTWENRLHRPGSEVTVRLWARGRNETAIRLRHSKLKTAKDAANLKQGWSWAMDSLRSFLETGKPIRHSDWLEKMSGKNK